MVDRLSLQVKIIGIFAVTVMVVLVVSTLIATFLRATRWKASFTARRSRRPGRPLTRSPRRKSWPAPTCWSPSLSQLQHDAPGILQADVYVHSPNHHLVASTNPHGQHLELDDIPDIETYLEFYKPFNDQESIETEQPARGPSALRSTRSGVPIGCLILTVSPARALNAVTLDLVMRNLLLMLASFVVVVLVIHFFFLRAVRRPIKEMIRVMQSAEKGAASRSGRAWRVGTRSACLQHT